MNSVLDLFPESYFLVALVTPMLRESEGAEILHFYEDELRIL